MLTALKAYGARVDVSFLDRINAAYGRRYGRPIETAADDNDNDNEEPFDDGPTHGSGGSEVKSEAAAAAAVAVVGIAKEAPRGSDDHGGDAKGEHGRGGGDSEDEPPSSGSSSREGVPQGSRPGGARLRGRNASAPALGHVRPRLARRGSSPLIEMACDKKDWT